MSNWMGLLSLALNAQNEVSIANWIDGVRADAEYAPNPQFDYMEIIAYLLRGLRNTRSNLQTAQTTILELESRLTAAESRLTNHETRIAALEP
jgi:hypothetical protein